MLLLKSVFAGIAASVVAAIVTAVAMIGWLLVMSLRLPEGQTIGWDPVSFFRQSWLSWPILVSAFVLGFVWEYRRAR